MKLARFSITVCVMLLGFLAPNAAEATPSPVSVTPNSGTGATQTFAFLYSDSIGASNIASAQIDISASLVAAGACYLYWGHSTNQVYLNNDAGNNWGSGAILGTGGTLQNSQCTVNASASSSSIVGNNLTLTLALTFKAAYPGAKNTYMEAYDTADSGWSLMGAWTVPGGVPSPVSVTPNSGTGATQTFAFVYSDSAGASNIVSAQMDISSSLVVAGACYLYWGSATDQVFLENDAGNDWGSGATLGSGGTLQNSQCTVNASGSSFTTAGNNLTVNLALTFKPAYAGAKNTYMEAYGTADSGWSQKGTWTVPGSQNPNFTITVSPSAQTMAPGDGTSYPVTLTSVNGFSGNVNLSASGLGSGATATFTPSSVSVSSSGPVSSILTIATTTGAQAGTFTVTVTGTGGVSTPASTSLILSTASTPATQLSTFITCAGSGSATYCALPTLPAGSYYTVSQTIAVGHSNVTVTGGGSSLTTSATVLVRAQANTNPMMRVSGSSPLTGVKIQNLTFCGGNTLPNIVPSTTCPLPVTTPACGNGSNCIDLTIDNADSGQFPGSPFTYTGPYSVTIANCDFENATGHAISFQPVSPQKVNDIYIHNSVLNSSSVTGIHADGNGVSNGVSFTYDRKICDGDPTFKDNTNVFLPRNIRIEGNTFKNNNTGAIGMQARYVGLRTNTFMNNYINPQAGNTAGGTVFFNQCADSIDIVGNTLTGPTGAIYTQGLELWGRNITVEGSNSITSYPSSGIQLNSVYNVTIQGPNQIMNNGMSSSEGTPDGIAVWTAGFPGHCDEIPRDTQNVTISNDTITGQSYSVFLGDYGIFSRNTITTLSVTGGTLGGIPVGIAPIVALTGYTGTPTTPAAGNSVTPRDLPVDAVSPITTRCCSTTCSSTSSADEVFTFAGADLSGSSNVAAIEGVFSATGNDSDGTPGPVAPVCHFLYVPTANVVYLDATTGLGQWLGSSIVGSGGSDLTNSSCTIHAGYASSQGRLEAKVASVTLAIYFPLGSGPHRHIYERVQNGQGHAAPAAWQYWGYVPIP